MIFSIIGALICLFGLINYKKGFFVFLLFKTILVPNINIISLPSLPMVTLELFLSIYFFVLYCIHGKKYSSAKISFPYSVPAVFLMMSWFMSSIFSVAGFKAEITRVISMSLSEILIILIIWQLVETDSDFFWIIKWLTFIIIITCIYGIFEYITKQNPVLNYEISLVSDVSKITNWNMYGETIRGYRVQSFFDHAIGAGLNWSLYIIWIYTASVKFSCKIPNVPVAFFASVLCLPCIILSNSRAPIVFLFINFICLFNPKNKKMMFFIILSAFVLVIVSPLLFKYQYNFASIFNQKIQRAVGGSTIAMRFEQLDACIEIWKRSPIFGMGAKFIDYMELKWVLVLRGMESIWFVALVEYGLFGVLAYLIRALFEIVLIPKYFKSREAFVLAISYWITYTLTSLPGFLTYLYYIIMFFYIKKSIVYVRIKKYKSFFPVKIMF